MAETFQSSELKVNMMNQKLTNGCGEVYKTVKMRHRALGVKNLLKIASTSCRSFVSGFVKKHHVMVFEQP